MAASPGKSARLGFLQIHRNACHFLLLVLCDLRGSAARVLARLARVILPVLVLHQQLSHRSARRVSAASPRGLPQRGTAVRPGRNEDHPRPPRRLRKRRAPARGHPRKRFPTDPGHERFGCVSAAASRGSVFTVPPDATVGFSKPAEMCMARPSQQGGGVVFEGRSPLAGGKEVGAIDSGAPPRLTQRGPKPRRMPRRQTLPNNERVARSRRRQTHLTRHAR